MQLTPACILLLAVSLINVASGHTNGDDSPKTSPKAKLEVAPAPRVAAPKIKTTADLLIGIWILDQTESRLDKGVVVIIEFSVNNTVTVRITYPNGKKSPDKVGTYLLNNSILKLNIEKPPAGEEDSELTIQEITDSKLITIDSNKHTTIFKRVKK